MTNNAAGSHQGAALSVTIIPDCLCSLQSSSHLLPHRSLPYSYGNKYKVSTTKKTQTLSLQCLKRSSKTILLSHGLVAISYSKWLLFLLATCMCGSACRHVVIPLSVDLHTVFRGRAHNVPKPHTHIIHIIVDSKKLVSRISL